MNTRNDYRSLLKYANKDLKKLGKSLVLLNDEGYFSIDILSSNGRRTNYAENYFESELSELVNDAWSFVRQSA